MKIAYKRKRFGAAALAKIAVAETICDEYAVAGYSLTVRQLY